MDVLVIDLSKAPVMEVKGAQLIASESYMAGYTLRFPRIVRVRDDKGWEDVSTVDDLKTGDKKKKKRVSKTENPTAAPVKIVSTLLSGLSCVILNSSHPGLESLVRSHSGQVLQNYLAGLPDQSTLVFADHFDYKA